jgi:hypothetical protein
MTDPTNQLKGIFRRTRKRRLEIIINTPAPRPESRPHGTNTIRTTIRPPNEPMITDRTCLDCGDYTFTTTDAAGKELTTFDSHRVMLTNPPALFTDVACPECGRQQGLVVQPRSSHHPIYTIWPCSWNDEPCTEDGCGYCEGEYV